nr:hypothetical protein [Burkholderia plantarii]
MLGRSAVVRSVSMVWCWYSKPVSSVCLTLPVAKRQTGSNW